MEYDELDDFCCEFKEMKMEDKIDEKNKRIEKYLLWRDPFREVIDDIKWIERADRTFCVFFSEKPFYCRGKVQNFIKHWHPYVLFFEEVPYEKSNIMFEVEGEKISVLFRKNKGIFSFIYFCTHSPNLIQNTSNRTWILKLILTEEKIKPKNRKINNIPVLSILKALYIKTYKEY